jgi:hypothetical protein
MMADQDTEIMSTGALEATIIYNYRLVNLRAADISSSSLIETMKPRVTNAACTTPQTRDEFLKNGITLRYAYYDTNRTHIRRRGRREGVL